MKKLCILLAFMLATISVLFVGCGETLNTVTTVKVNEVTHSIFYAPFYVAINNGYFADGSVLCGT